jgi:hypothetical protein
MPPLTPPAVDLPALLLQTLHLLRADPLLASAIIGLLGLLLLASCAWRRRPTADRRTQRAAAADPRRATTPVQARVVAALRGGASPAAIARDQRLSHDVVALAMRAAVRDQPPRPATPAAARQERSTHRSQTLRPSH